MGEVDSVDDCKWRWENERLEGDKMNHSFRQGRRYPGHVVSARDSSGAYEAVDGRCHHDAGILDA